MGVDLSYVNEIQDYGAVYRDSGTVADPFVIMMNHGANTVRVRLWHNPLWVGEITGGCYTATCMMLKKRSDVPKAQGWL